MNSKLLMSSFDKKDLLNVYIVNPDYCIIFSDLVHEVLSCVKDWIDSGVYVDYSTARIGVMNYMKLNDKIQNNVLERISKNSIFVVNS